MRVIACKEKRMEIWIAGIATIGLTIYLLYALIRPEQF
jgi:K+-transporting ATPase KdpF subunit